MGKNKRRGNIAPPAGPSSRKPHEPNVFERAFLEAEAKNNTDSRIRNVAPVKTAGQPNVHTSEVPGPAGQKVGHKQFPASKPSSSSTSTPPKKRIYIPQQTSSKNNATIRPEAIPKKPPTIPSQRNRVIQVKAPTRLGLKPLLANTGGLNVGACKGEREKLERIIIHNINEECGKSQVHSGIHSDESDVVIGFDFGTSSSKIVFRDSGRQTAYAVPFGSLACPGNDYLVPTSIFISDDGNLSLSAGGYSYADLKINLMDNPDLVVFKATNTSLIITASELASAYIALVISFARSWFLKHTESIYKKTHIHWHINLGVPSQNYDDQKTRKTFQSIAMAAWRISLLEGIIGIADVGKNLPLAMTHLLTDGKDIDPANYESLWLHPDFVNTHPEVIMEVVGYARSPLRTAGLHLIIDVGATTLDAATFIIHSHDAEDCYPLLETKVERYGTMVLHSRRMEAIVKSLEGTIRQRNSVDPTKPLPDSGHYEIRVEEEDLSENDAAFFKEGSALIGSLIRDTKNRRDPYSSAWENGLPVFICGGGGRDTSYLGMIRKLGAMIASGVEGFRGFALKDLPKPDQLYAPDLPHNEYDRLAVAYGLSFTSDEIGEIIPGSKLSDIRKKVKPIGDEDRFVSKDMC